MTIDGEDIGSFRRAVEYFQRGEFDLAIELLESYLEVHSDSFDGAHILGACYVGRREYLEAFKYFRLAFEIDSESVMLNLNMAKSYFMVGEFAKAYEHAEICLRYDSGNVDAMKILVDTKGHSSDYVRAIEFYERGEFDLSLPLLEKHLESFPDDALCMEHLGIIHCGLKNYDLGFHFFYLGLSRDAGRQSIYYNMASAYYYLGESDRAFAFIRLCLSYGSEHASSYYLLSKLHQERGDLPQAVLALRDYLHLCPSDKLVLCDLLYNNLQLLRFAEVGLDFAELFSGDYSMLGYFPAMLLLDDLGMLREFASNYAFALGDDISVKKRVSGDKIRVGYICSDIRNHPVFYISSHLFCEHDRADFEIYLYSTSVFDGSSDVIKFAMDASDYYRDLSDKSDADSYDIIRGDDLDIMVDLIGYTGGNGSRRSLLAMGLSPVLINYLGYMGSMGTSYHDYIIADEHVIPRESAKHYSEEVLYVDCVFSYDRSLLLGGMVGKAKGKGKGKGKVVKGRSDFGLSDGGIILGVFNRPIKITESIFVSWMRILESCPDSYLWVSFDLECSRLAFIERACEHGISSDRLIMCPSVKRSEYMRRYDFCDLCLDTYPYNGGMTSLDSLHGGCPILTLSGETMMSRVTGSLLMQLDLGELIADSVDDYVEKAIGLIGDRERLKSLRKHIGDRLHGSVIYDSKKMTRQLEEHYRTILKTKA